MSRRHVGIVAACLLITATAVLRSLDCLRSFILCVDDIHGAVALFNAAGTSLADTVRWAFLQGGFSYSPLTHFAFRLPPALGWGSPLGFRALAVTLLAANACMVFFIAAHLVRDRRWALAAALFYTLLPMHNENATCLGIPMYLAVLFILLGFYTHMRGGERQASVARTLLLCALYLLAMLAKEIGLLLPALLLAYDLCDPLERGNRPLAGRRSRREYAALLATALLYGALRLSLAGGAASVTLSAVPKHLWEAAASWSVLVSAVLLLFARRRQGPAPAVWRTAVFCAAWFLVGTSVLLLLPNRYILIGRYLFLSYIGAAFLAAAALDAIARRRGALWCVPAGALLLLAVMLDGRGELGCSGRRSQLKNIRDNLATCAGPADKIDCVSGALSLPLIRDGAPGLYRELTAPLPADLTDFFGSGRLDSGDARWRYLAQVWEPLTGADAKLDAFRTYLDAERRFQEGNRQQTAGRYAQASRMYGQAVELWPGYLEARFQNARALSAAGKHEEARASYAKVMTDEMGRYSRDRLIKAYCSPPDSCGFLHH
ncbi:MAG: tetratricopeptide repeat protein [Elusimicrobiota bacterium]